MLHMLQWLYTYVVSFCSQCFICFYRRMLQVCLFECCICFTHMLQVFYLDVTYIIQWFQVFFFRCFCKYFICLQTYIASVAYECFKSKSGVASFSSHYAVSPRVSPPPSSVGWAFEPEAQQALHNPPPSSRC